MKHVTESINEKNKKIRVIAYYAESGVLFGIFDSIYDAAKKMKTKNVKSAAYGISQALKGDSGRKSAYGFIWRKLDDYNPYMDRALKRLTIERLRAFRASGGRYNQLQRKNLTEHEIRDMAGCSIYPIVKWELLAKSLDEYELGVGRNDGKHKL